MSDIEEARAELRMALVDVQATSKRCEEAAAAVLDAERASDVAHERYDKARKLWLRLGCESPNA